MTKESPKASVRDVLESERKFWLPEVVSGGLEALQHLADTGELREPYPGLFWRGTATRFGMANPPLDLLLTVILPKGGWGYTEYSAANHLGLSTQIPKNVAVSTPYIPEHGAPPFVEFTHRPGRSGRARHKLSKYEISLLEVLTGITVGKSYMEVSTDEAMATMKEGLRMRTEIGIAVIPRLIAGSISEPLEVRSLLKEIIFH